MSNRRPSGSNLPSFYSSTILSDITIDSDDSMSVTSGPGDREPPEVEIYKYGNQYDVADRMRYTRPVSSLGVGSYGNVNQVTGIPGSREFAVKTISFGDRGRAESAITEWNMFHILSHPNIMKPIDITHSDDYQTVNFAMPVAADDLLNYIDGPEYLDVEEIREIAWQVLSALDYLHTNKIIHRDIKPNNIIGYRNSLKFMITDFGLAKYMYFDPQGNFKSLVQNKWYRAPEIFAFISYHRRQRSNTLRSGEVPPPIGPGMDIWALGVTLLELLSRKSAFKDIPPGTLPTRPTDNDIWDLITTDYMINTIDSRLSGMDANIIDLLKGMLEIHPDDRYTAAQALNSPWFADKSYVPAEIIPIPSVPLGVGPQHKLRPFIDRSDLSIESAADLFGFGASTRTYAKLLRTYLFAKGVDRTVLHFRRLNPKFVDGAQDILNSAADMVTMEALHRAIVLLAAYQVDEAAYYNRLGMEPSLTHLVSSDAFPSQKLVLDMFKFMGYNIIVHHEHNES